MVPGSTLRYGSHFCRVTLKPRLSRRQPIEEAATPFPSEETTPPVTKIYFGAILSSPWLAWVVQLTGPVNPPQEGRTNNYGRNSRNCQCNSTEASNQKSYARDLWRWGAPKPFSTIGVQ